EQGDPADHPAELPASAVLHVLSADPGDIGEVAGDQRQHAGAGERHEARGGRDGHGEQEVAVGDQVLRRRADAHLPAPVPPTWAMTSAGRPAWRSAEPWPPLTAPVMVAPTRPCGSITSVAGWNDGAWSLSWAVSAAEGSYRDG